MKNVASFAIDYVQYLNSDGHVTQEIPTFAKNPENLISMYRLMQLVRVFDTKAVALQRTGKLGTYAGILGQEAISVAIGAAMHKDDVLCPAYREYGAFLQRGVRMQDILAFWGGDERGSDFASKEDFPMCVPIATQCLHAAGVAVAFKHRQQPRVAVAVCGDGATSKGDFYESLNLAGDWQLPFVMVVNNNQWAISVPREEQTGAKTLAQKAIAAGIPSIQVDGNDIIATHEQIEKAINRARAGEGPSLVEAITYRLCDHTTADDAKRYRSDEELEQAWQQEPIIRLRRYLQSINAWNEEQEEKLIQECNKQVAQAVDAYLNTEKAPATDMFDYLYESLPQAYQEQRQELEGK